jgi:hypothetical protein
MCWFTHTISWDWGIGKDRSDAEVKTVKLESGPIGEYRPKITRHAMKKKEYFEYCIIDIIVRSLK